MTTKVTVCLFREILQDIADQEHLAAHHVRVQGVVRGEAQR